MKRIIIFAFVSLIFISCSQDLKSNSPGFQASKNNKLWTGVNLSATKSASGQLNIVAQGDEGTIDLKIANYNLGTFYLGTNSNATFASYNTTINGVVVSYDTAPLVGSVATIESPILYTGDNYVASGSATTTGGTGSGLTVKTEVSLGTVTKVTILAPGINYTPGDIVTIVGGNNFAQFVVQNVEGSNGEITITDKSNGTITGTFKFNAKSATSVPNGSQFVNFQSGNFFKIPVKNL